MVVVLHMRLRVVGVAVGIMRPLQERTGTCEQFANKIESKLAENSRTFGGIGSGRR